MKNKKLVILLAIVLVIILGVAIYFAIPKNNNNAQKEEQKLEQEQVIEEGQKQYSQINLENTENAKVEDGKKINTPTRQRPMLTFMLLMISGTEPGSRTFVRTSFCFPPSV